MKKLTSAIVIVLLLNVLPLLGHPHLIIHIRNIVLMISNGLIMLTQPAFSLKETESNKGRDQYTIVLILAMSVISILSAVLLWGYGDPYFNNLPWTVAGLILIGLGLFYRIWSISTLGRQFTATVRFEQKHQLIETGPYKLVRHPSYLGAYITIIGYPVFLHTPLGIGIAAVAMFIAYYFRIRAEEAALLRHFGDTYGHYQQRTYRIIPFLW